MQWEERNIGAPSRDPGHFVIGVTGHRDLVAEESSRTCDLVREVLADLAGAAFGLRPLVISGLAEGADSLVSNVALDMGFDVEAVLPMPLEFFRDDFQGETREILRDLLDNPAIRVRALELDTGANRTAGLTDSARTRQYALLKDHIQNRSDVLVALWDGTRNGLEGGTGDVVASYLAGRSGNAPPTEVSADGRSASASSRLVVWIPVSRRMNAEPNTMDGPIFLVSDESGATYWRQAEMPKVVVAGWRGVTKPAPDG